MREYLSHSQSPNPPIDVRSLSFLVSGVGWVEDLLEKLRSYPDVPEEWVSCVGAEADVDKLYKQSGWRNRSTHQLRQYPVPSQVTLSLVKAVLRGECRSRKSIVDVECAARVMFLHVVSKMERVAVSRLWLLAFMRLAGAEVAAPCVWSADRVSKFDIDFEGCGSGRDVFGAYFRYIGSCADFDLAWSRFGVMATATVNCYYNNRGWSPPRHCFRHLACPHLPGIELPPRGRDSPWGEDVVEAVWSFWSDCFEGCTCGKHSEGFDPSDADLVLSIWGDVDELAKRRAYCYSDVFLGCTESMDVLEEVVDGDWVEVEDNSDSS